MCYSPLYTTDGTLLINSLSEQHVYRPTPAYFKHVNSSWLDLLPRSAGRSEDAYIHEDMLLVDENGNLIYRTWELFH